MRFSDRIGVTSPPTVVQLDDIDAPLRNQLWNLVDRAVLQKLQSSLRYGSATSHIWKAWRHKLWDEFFKHPADQSGDDGVDTRQQIRDWFFKIRWFEVYNFLEFVAGMENMPSGFRDAANIVLERERSGFRFVDGCLAPISSDAEVATVRNALSATERGMAPVNEHLKTSLALFSDRTSPDFRNSVKESISAVEALAVLIAKDDNATLGRALKVIAAKIPIHPALQGAFEKMYGWTSDDGGIRHALTDESTPVDFDDAKFMLVACSAFVNFLIGKWERAGSKKA